MATRKHWKGSQKMSTEGIRIVCGFVTFFFSFLRILTREAGGRGWNRHVWARGWINFARRSSWFWKYGAHPSKFGIYYEACPVHSRNWLVVLSMQYFPTPRQTNAILCQSWYIKSYKDQFSFPLWESYCFSLFFFYAGIYSCTQLFSDMTYHNQIRVPY